MPAKLREQKHYYSVTKMEPFHFGITIQSQHYHHKKINKLSIIRTMTVMSLPVHMTETHMFVHIRHAALFSALHFSWMVQRSSGVYFHKGNFKYYFSLVLIVKKYQSSRYPGYCSIIIFCSSLQLDGPEELRGYFQKGNFTILVESLLSKKYQSSRYPGYCSIIIFCTSLQLDGPGELRGYFQKGNFTILVESFLLKKVESILSDNMSPCCQEYLCTFKNKFLHGWTL